MITELASQDKVIGVKQSRKAIRDGRARRVFVACDADPAITEPVADGCASAGIPVETEYTMAQLGKACRITVAPPWWLFCRRKNFGFFGIAKANSAKNKDRPKKRRSKI